MSSEKINLQRITWIALLGVLITPMLLPIIDVKSKPLYGKATPAAAPVPSVKNWFDGTFQKTTDDYLADHWALRGTATRLCNEIQYDLFSQTNVSSVVIGRDGQLYSSEYVLSAQGKDRMSDSAIDATVAKIKTLQDTLAHHGVTLYVMMIPGKPLVYPEYLPARYRPSDTARTNNTAFAQAFAREGVNHVDLLPWMRTQKATALCPLYPRTDFHWSYYSTCLVQDTLTHALEKLTGRDLPDQVVEDIAMSDTARREDQLTYNLLNLMRTQPRQKLAYPVFHYEGDAQQRPRSLIIGDSYYRGLVLSKFNRNVLNGDYWYYYSSVKTASSVVKSEELKHNLKNEILKRNVIVLEAGDANLPVIGFGFIDDALLAFTDSAAYTKRSLHNEKVEAKMKLLRKDAGVMKPLEAQAERDHIPLEMLLRRKAEEEIGDGEK